MACPQVSVDSCDPARRALDYVARYDTLRLRAYRDCEGHGNRIRIDNIGPQSRCASTTWAISIASTPLHGGAATTVTTMGTSGFSIRPPADGEKTLFLRSYPRAFGANPAVFPAALRNMRHLFDRPELDFLIAWRKSRPAGIGMLYRVGDAALLCAGATLPGMRRRGCHQALIAVRRLHRRAAAGL